MDGGTDGPRRELVVQFWTLVLLAKLAVIAIGGGILFLAFTEYLIAGGLLVLIGIAVGLRWAYLYRQAQHTIDTPDHT